MKYGAKDSGAMRTPKVLPKPKPKIGDVNEGSMKSPYTVKNGKMVMTGKYATD